MPAEQPSTHSDKRKAQRPYKKQNPTLEQRIQILDWHHEHSVRQEDTVAHFKDVFPTIPLGQSTLSKWLKPEVELRWRTQWANRGNGVDRMSRRMSKTAYPRIDEMMVLWIQKAMEDGIPMSGELLRQRWKHFAKLTNIPEDKHPLLSNGWLDRFKYRLGLKEFRQQVGAAQASARPETVQAERERIRQLIAASGFALRDIFNMDETVLFSVYPPDRSLADQQMSGKNGRKYRLTYVFACNADGSEKLPAFTIGKFKKPQAFKDKSAVQLGLRYRSNRTAWMTAEMYQDWIREWDWELRQQNRKVLLLQDNFSGHIVPTDLTNIRVENFAPNFTAHVQPMDQGIIRCFKAHYRLGYMAHVIGNHNAGVASGEIYDIDQLAAMRKAETAWTTVSAATIRNCWQKSGILPPLSTDTPASSPSRSSSPPPDAEQSDPSHSEESDVDSELKRAIDDLTRAVDKLETKGVLQKSNRLSIDEFIRPAREEQLLEDITDQEIVEAVMEAAEDEAQDDNDNPPPLPADRPTREEVLQAVNVLSRYASVLDNPIARQLEAVLASFTQTHLLQ